MNQHKRRLLATAVICLALASGAWVCNANQIQKAAIAAKDFAASVQTFQKTEIALYNANYLTADEHRALETIILQVAISGKKLDLAINQTKNAADATAALDACLADTSQLLTEAGVVKNVNTRAELQAAVLTLRGLLATISEVVKP